MAPASRPRRFEKRLLAAGALGVLALFTAAFASETYAQRGDAHDVVEAVLRLTHQSATLSPEGPPNDGPDPRS